MYSRFVKRFFDVVISFFVMLLLCPIYVILFLLVRINLGSPVLFKQERPGYKGNIFKMFKFRTMLSPQTRDGRVLSDKERLECVEKGIDILSDDERLTKFGRFLRATSLDELPELWNILIGDMSIVGPRPFATIYLPYYTKDEMRRHDVRPGLTGMAQVHGRNDASWSKRFEYDLYYVDHCSLLLDIKIIIQTFVIVFKREGIGQGIEKPESFSSYRQRQWENGEIVKDR